MIKCLTEAVPGYPETAVKSELVISESGVMISRVLDAKIFVLELETTDITVVNKMLKLSNEDFRLFGAISTNISENLEP